VKLRLRVDILECDVTGKVVDYVLVNDHGDVIARLGPDGATEREKEDLLDDLGMKGPWGNGGYGSEVGLEVKP